MTHSDAVTVTTLWCRTDADMVKAANVMELLTALTQHCLPLCSEHFCAYKPHIDKVMVLSIIRPVLFHWSDQTGQSDWQLVVLFGSPTKVDQLERSKVGPTVACRTVCNTNFPHFLMSSYSTCHQKARYIHYLWYLICIYFVRFSSASDSVKCQYYPTFFTSAVMYCIIQSALHV